VDDRGRLKLPAEAARYFVQLDENVVFVTTTDEKTARIYRLDDWRENEIKLANHLDQKAARLMQFRTAFYGERCTIDPQGRIALPAELRQALKLDDQEIRLLHFKSHFDAYTLEAATTRLEEARQANLDDVDSTLD
jgi:DNA-binding transcriptional regulator/RsmH inhibitor MraZ